MRTDAAQSAFTLIEMLVVMATILILAGALLGVGKYLMVRAAVDLTESQLGVIDTALQQYYDDFDDFPFETDMDDDGDFFDDIGLPDYKETDLEDDLSGTVDPDNAIDDLIDDGNPDNDPDDPAAALSTALFYFLDNAPNSRMIIEALTDSLISNKDADGRDIKIELDSGETIDLPRFIDAWGTSLRYEYAGGMTFPELTSAGPDTEFDTPDDIVN